MHWKSYAWSYGGTKSYWNKILWQLGCKWISDYPPIWRFRSVINQAWNLILFPINKWVRFRNIILVLEVKWVQFQNHNSFNPFTKDLACLKKRLCILERVRVQKMWLVSLGMLLENWQLYHPKTSVLITILPPICCFWEECLKRRAMHSSQRRHSNDFAQRYYLYLLLFHYKELFPSLSVSMQSLKIGQ